MFLLLMYNLFDHMLCSSQTQNLVWHTGENHQKINLSTEMTHIIRIRNQYDLDLRFCQITYCQKTYCPIAVCQITFCQKAVCQKTFCLFTDTPRTLIRSCVNLLWKVALSKLYKTCRGNLPNGHLMKKCAKFEPEIPENFWEMTKK